MTQEDNDLNDLERKMERNYRIMDLCLGIPIKYDGKVHLTEELKKNYSGNFGEVIREMVADNIQIADITSSLNNLFNMMWKNPDPTQQLTEDFIKNLIEKMIEGKTR